MNDMDYIQRKRNRKKQFLRIRLGVLQMIHKPFLNVLLFPIIAGTVFLWMRREVVLSLFDIPPQIFSVCNYVIIMITILLPIISILAMIEVIGDMTARPDEANLQNAFSKQELRNGCPILMGKKRIKRVIRREFYSEIPMRIWVEKQEDIADAMNVRFVEKLSYGGKSPHGKRIVMYTVKGRKIISRGELYDEEI